METIAVSFPLDAWMTDGGLSAGAVAGRVGCPVGLQNPGIDQMLLPQRALLRQQQRGVILGNRLMIRLEGGPRAVAPEACLSPMVAML